MILTIMFMSAFFIMCAYCIKIIHEKQALFRKYDYLNNQYCELVKIIKSDYGNDAKISNAIWYIDQIPF
jgi:hypothetical protein